MITREYACKDCGKIKLINIQKNNYEKYIAKYPRCHPCGAKYAESKIKVSWFKKGNSPWNKDTKGVMPKPWNKGNGEYKNRKNYHGYILIYCPEHKYANKDGYVLEHRYVYEKKINRTLESFEIIHHINENRSDNRLENLQLFASNGEHLRHHMALRKKI